MTAAAGSVIVKIDQLLEGDDKNISTRSGLRLLGEVLREAMDAISSTEGAIEESIKARSSMDVRIQNLEKALYDFLKMREKEQEEAKVERKRWRWAIISPMIAILMAEIARLLIK